MSNKNSSTPEVRKPGLFRRTLQRHWLGLMVVSVLGIVGSVVAIRSATHPQYRAFSILRIDPPSSPLYGVVTSSETFDQFIQTQIQLILSPNVLKGASTNSKLSALPRFLAARDVVPELRKVVDVSGLPGTYLIEVSMTSPEPHEAQVIVNAVVDSYLNTQEEWTDGLNRNKIKKLEEYVHDLKNQTDKIEERWKELVARGHLDRAMPGNAQAQNQPAWEVDRFQKTKNEILDIDLQVAEAEAVLATAKAALMKEEKSANPVDEKSRMEKWIERKFQADPEVIRLAAEMMKANEKVETAQKRTKADALEIKAAREQLERLKDQYNRLWEEKSEFFRAEIQLTAVRDRGILEVSELTAKVQTLQTRRKALEALLSQLVVAIQNRANNVVDLQLLLDQRSSLKQMQDTVKLRLEQLKYESRGETRVRLINTAMLPTRPITDKRLTYMTIASFAVLFATFSLFLIFEAATGSRPPVPVIVASNPEPTPEV